MSSSISLHTTPSAFSLNSNGGSPILEILFDGQVKWSGPPSQGSRLLLKSLRSVIDLDSVGDAAAERIYRRAIEKCLNMARSMDRDEFIDQLDRELQTRISKAVLLELKNERKR